jgi:hypothetical protein
MFFNPPTLPTDNLYKFIAIAGLIILIVGNGYNLYFTNELAAWYRQQLSEWSVLNVEIEYTIKETAQLNEILKQTSGNNELQKYYQEKMDKLLSDAKAQDIKKAIFDERLKISGENKRKQDILLVVAILSNIIGSMLLIAGLRLWYTRVQIYQDRILKDQAEGNGTNQQVNTQPQNLENSASD